MKYICLLSHKQPGTEPGKFKAFEAGQEYEAQEVGDAEPGYFRAVYGVSEGVTGQGAGVKKAKIKV